MYVPFVISFRPRETRVMRACEIAMEVALMLDVGLQFNVARVGGPEAKLLMERRAIAAHYLRLWFWVDALASAPVTMLGEQRRPELAALFRPRACTGSARQALGG